MDDRSYTPLVKKVEPVIKTENGTKKKKDKKDNAEEPAGIALFWFYILKVTVVVEVIEEKVPEDPQLILARRGAIFSIRSAVSQFGDKLFEGLPKILSVQPVSFTP